MKILAVAWTACSTAALMIDGEVVACVSEERFSRVKNDESYPKRAIEACLEIGGISASDLDVVVFSTEQFDAKAILTHKYSRFSVADRMREEKKVWEPRIYRNEPVVYLDVFADKVDIAQYPGPAEWNEVMRFMRRSDTTPAEEKAYYQAFRRQVIATHLGIPRDKVTFANHHRAHAYYAYYGSPMPRDRVLIMTADAWGDDENGTISLGEGGNITSIHVSNNFQGARLYRSMTLLLGMKPDEHEYKVMGLAAYAKPEYYKGPYEVFRSTQYVDGLGFAYKTKPADLYVWFRDRLEGYRFDAIAGALQQYTEELMTEWTENALRATGARRVVYGGGAAMNVKAIMRIASLPEVDELFVCPTPSDESLAIGSAYVVMHDAVKARGGDPSKVLRPLPHAYLGPAPTAREIDAVVRDFAGDPGYRVRDRVDPRYIARLVTEGRIVGRCAGRCEFGARALGNRSIIADPRNTNVIRTINERIKSRDFWMPFAPSIKLERADDYLANRKGMRAPYMTQAFATTPLAQRELIAGLHQADLTCRPQLVDRTMNREYHELISEFEAITGVGGVLNTSFNLHGEPIVQTPADAARVYRLSKLDVLLFDGALVEKKAEAESEGYASVASSAQQD